MNITKSIDFTLDIEDPILFASEIDKNIKDLIKIQYGGKCFKKMLIIDVIALEIVSPLYVSVKNEAYVNVRAKVSGIEYTINSILVGANIRANNSGLIHATYDGKVEGFRNTVVISMNPTITIGEKTQVIKHLSSASIVLKHVEHTVYGAVRVIGSVLLPDFEDFVYYVEDDLSDDDYIYIGELINMIKKELSERQRYIEAAQENIKMIKMLENIFYTYKIKEDVEQVIQVGDHKYTGLRNTVSNAINLIEYLESRASFKGTWSRPLKIYRSSLFVAKTAEAKHIITPPLVAAASMLKHMLNWLSIIRQHYEYYTPATLTTDAKSYISLIASTKM